MIKTFHIDKRNRLRLNKLVTTMFTVLVEPQHLLSNSVTHDGELISLNTPAFLPKLGCYSEMDGVCSLVF